MTVAAAALGAGACGDDDDDQAAPERAAADPARYCALVAALDHRGEQVFGGLDQREASPADFEAAERRFVTGAAKDLAALRRAAPAALRDDVATFIAGMRGRAGLDDAPPSEARASAAEQRMLAYERRTCRR